MFRFYPRFIFPELIHQSQVLFSSKNKKSFSRKFTGLYKLNWGQFVVDVRHKVLRNIEQNIPELYDEAHSHTYALSEPWKNYLYSAKFAISDNYMKEIRRNTRRAMMEFNQERHFDTNIRELCLMPGIKHIETSFRLLSDCLYDIKTGYYYRGPLSSIMPNLMLCMFWMHQTGAGLIRDHACIEDIKNKYNYMTGQLAQSEEVPRKDYTKIIEFYLKFLNYFKVLEKTLLKENEIFSSNTENNTGPSLPGTSEE